MPVNTITVGAAVTPTVIETYISHYLNRRPLREKPTAHISYHEGLELIRRFLHYASFHTVEELQAFTSQWVPVPVWVHADNIEIPAGQLARSAEYIQAQLGPEGIKEVGGTKWWQWRRDNAPLKAEWIEMRKDYEERKKIGAQKGQRVMLYVHGGAYFFGSVDEHRYQMQRHARKLKARVIAPRYRLSPQFPFPCGLQDCLATYLHLLEQKHDPSTIILAGDSAGGGMVVSMLVTLRDQGVPLPAGAILISPWVDLTHSFPSLGGDGKMDYIPAHGFMAKPSISWPPPNSDDLLSLERISTTPHQQATATPRTSHTASRKEEKDAKKEAKKERVRGFSVTDSSAEEAKKSAETAPDVFVSADGKYSIGPKSMLSVQLDGKRVEIKDQIQMYAPNHLLTHPLVSPVLQPTLGGLPPLLIQTGGAELLHDEQIYLAHKASQPLAYLPPPSNHLTAEAIQAQAARYRPTNVQLQVWDDLCHVAPTLSFTRPAKHMYRSIAQFGAWVLARAQKTSIDILDDDSISFVSSGSSGSSTSESECNPSGDDIKLAMPQSAQHVSFAKVNETNDKHSRVGRAGDPLPPFKNHMIRQRIDRHGHIYDLAPREKLVALNLPTMDIGVPKSGPVNKWMKAQAQWNGKFAKQKIKIQKQRMKDLEKGFEGFDGETPPPTAMAGRRIKGMAKEKKKKKSWGMAMWSGWGSKHDSDTLDREKTVDENPDQEAKTSTADGSTELKPPPKPRASRRRSSGLHPHKQGTDRSRSHSRVNTVTDKGQITPSVEDLTRSTTAAPTPGLGLAEATPIAPERKASPLPSPRSEFSAPPGIVIQDTDTDMDALSFTSRPQSPQTLIPETDGSSTRPTRGGVAYPFSLRVEGVEGDVNASMVTLQSVGGADGVGAGEGQGGEKGEGVVVEKGVGQTSAAAAATATAVKQEHDEAQAGQLAEKEVGERPGIERFETAGMGDFGKSEGGAGLGLEKEKLERPGVERFETAQEDLAMLAGANGSKAIV